MNNKDIRPPSKNEALFADAHDLIQAMRAHPHADHSESLDMLTQALNALATDYRTLHEAFIERTAQFGHEVRGALNAVIGFSELLLEHLTDPLTQEQAKFLNDIRTSGERIQQLLIQFDQQEIAASYWARVDMLEAERKTSAEILNNTLYSMRASMAGIKASLNLLLNRLDDPLTERQINLLDAGYRNALRLFDYMTRTLYIAGIRRGTFHVLREPVQLGEILREVSQEIAPLAEHKQHHFTNTCDQALPIALGDSHWLHFALTELLTNAVSYTPEGGIISLRATETEVGINVTVQDNGIGMNRQELAHFGEPFWRGTHRLVWIYQGHGTGVYLARHLVRMMGGKFDVESAPGQGTSIALTLLSANDQT